MSEFTPDTFFRGDKMSGEYINLRPGYPPELPKYIINFLNKTPGSSKLHVDVGCGSGQSTIMMSQYFDKVLGFDLSPDQIQRAKERSNIPNNVEFNVGSCSDIPIEAGSVDLITAGTCIHWFNLDEFFPEVDRILRPGGCLAIYSYLETDIECDDPDKTKALQKVLRKYEDDILENNRPEQWGVPWAVLKSRFRDLHLPYDQDCQRGVMFNIKEKASVARFVELVKSYSESKEFIRRTPELAAETFDKLNKDLMAAMGNSKSADETIITYILPVFMALARKPESKEE